MRQRVPREIVRVSCHEIPLHRETGQRVRNDVGNMKSLLRSLFFVAAGLLVVAVIRAAQSGRGEDRAEEPSRPETEEPGHDDIASRAYFIALDHERRGEPHDPLADWAEAETELVGAEQARPPLADGSCVREAALNGEK